MDRGASASVASNTAQSEGQHAHDKLVDINGRPPGQPRHRKRMAMIAAIMRITIVADRMTTGQLLRCMPAAVSMSWLQLREVAGKG